MEMKWTCPGCRAWNATIIAVGAEAGSMVGVRCPACGAEHEASVRFPSTRDAPKTVGVVWVRGAEIA